MVYKRSGYSRRSVAVRVTETAARYRYTEKNLLEEPCYYMYTPYEGREFLAAFLAHRRAAAQALLRQRPATTAERPPDVVLAEEFTAAALSERRATADVQRHLRSMEVLPARPGEVSVDTRGVLLDLWQAYLYLPDDGDRLAAPWLEFFLKRFEVTKKIYSSYSAALKPSTHDYRNLDHYASLAALITYRYRVTRDIRLLNSSIKLIDLLLSVDNSALSAAARLFVLAALRMETASVQELARAHGIVRA